MTSPREGTGNGRSGAAGPRATLPSMASDPSVPFGIGAALGALPLFPLPQAVLFPGAVLMPVKRPSSGR